MSAITLVVATTAGASCLWRGGAGLIGEDHGSAPFAQGSAAAPGTFALELDEADAGGPDHGSAPFAQGSAAAPPTFALELELEADAGTPGTFALELELEADAGVSLSLVTVAEKR